MEINNYSDLLEFIKLDNVTAKQGAEVVRKALKVVIILELTKDQLIKETELFINNWCIGNEGERPLFLGQSKIDFDIKEIWKYR